METVVAASRRTTVGVLARCSGGGASSSAPWGGAVTSPRTRARPSAAPSTTRLDGHRVPSRNDDTSPLSLSHSFFWGGVKEIRFAAVTALAASSKGVPPIRSYVDSPLDGDTAVQTYRAPVPVQATVCPTNPATSPPRPPPGGAAATCHRPLFCRAAAWLTRSTWSDRPRRGGRRLAFFFVYSGWHLPPRRAHPPREPYRRPDAGQERGSARDRAGHPRSRRGPR